ncbi:acidic leucine-rich nuclear phosphoprotein 32 family member A isoform X2 [Drosophila guanche]|uniref:Acidic leucine-rich nuclear phosphoprotein 32 family member A n=1 Tax=Drosophila guanche TaxID=7266 RepID=A0A3B0J1S1_DROGU|nr:acidic leucine-rich nuclear phosphoprotein 32 family member A isoform X2 [Drosophila guanche]SPP74925.1 blast:Acidic leucine-rich nuclear phosphoprotein 32 family member A [Drosophila guanche]
MEKRIELERRARKANQITELNLDNCRSTSIVGFTDEYTALESLSLINVGLTTLKGFPKLPNLKKLELSDNRISSGLNYLTTSPKLQYLNLSGNKIKDLETLKPLQEFKNLEVLDLFNNDATWVANYREKIFKMLPSLNFLDGFDCNEEEAQSEGDDDEEVNGNDSEEEVDDEEDGDSDDTDEDGDNGEVSLSEVYNDDLEEDNSDWEEGEGGGDDDEEDSDIDDADGEANESTASLNASKKEPENNTDESEARGKKRKHDG